MRFRSASRLGSVAAVCVAAAIGGGACVSTSGLAGAGGDPPSDASDDASSAALSLKPAALDFGPAGCGTEPPPQSVTLENQGATTLSYEASLPEASGFSLGGQHLT